MVRVTNLSLLAVEGLHCNALKPPVLNGDAQGTLWSAVNAKPLNKRCFMRNSRDPQRGETALAWLD